LRPSVQNSSPSPLSGYLSLLKLVESNRPSFTHSSFGNFLDTLGAGRGNYPTNTKWSRLLVPRQHIVLSPVTKVHAGMEVLLSFCLVLLSTILALWLLNLIYSPKGNSKSNIAGNSKSKPHRGGPTSIHGYSVEYLNILAKIL
jgi:hypothetical protein